ncbi:DNA repair protein XRCC1 [Dermatophagoides pteronyssinus]|uniref:DNA repair protein XRCC1 n=1 Tax=Dermatophagoides pteronyssinus TaxID=6956 RepID=UPI003F66C0B4
MNSMIKLSSIKSFSSESHKYPACNLLKIADDDESLSSSSSSSWKCDQWSDHCWIIIELSESAKIDIIEITNDCSAFIEIFSSAIDDWKNFKVLLPVFSILSPQNSRELKCPNERYKFTTEKFMPTTRSLPCKFIKCVCSQPYNKNIRYGIENIKIYGQKFQENKNDLDGEKRTPLWMKKYQFLDNKSFMVNDKYFQMNFDLSKSTSNQHQQSNVVNEKKIDHQMSSSSSSTKFETNRNRLPLNDDDSNNKNVNTIEQLSKPSTSSLKLGKKRRNHDSDSLISNVDNDDNDDDVDVVHQQRKQTVMSKKIRKPFEKLFDNVVFVISGYQNPIRAELKRKAIEMGAHYEPEWNSNCTHLICAFKDTPKYNHVKHSGVGKIVREQWIIDSYEQRKRLSCQNYLLEKFNGNNDDNDSDDDTNENFDDRNNNNDHIDENNIDRIKKVKQKLHRISYDNNNNNKQSQQQKTTVITSSSSSSSATKTMKTKPMTKMMMNRKNMLAKDDDDDYDSDIIYDLETEDEDNDNNNKMKLNEKSK